MRSRLTRPPWESSLILLRMLQVGAAYPATLRQTPEKCPGSVGHRRDIGGWVGRTEAMTPEQVFFVTIVFPLVSKINFCSLLKGKESMRWREWTGVEIEGRKEGYDRTESSVVILFTPLFSPLALVSWVLSSVSELIKEFFPSLSCVCWRSVFIVLF